MKLQVALDLFSDEHVFEMVDQVKEYADIFEIGSVMIYYYGLGIVRRLRAQFPDLVFLADMKISDGGYWLASDAFNAGADIVTVLGVASDGTIQGAIKAAKEYRKKCTVDMISVPNLYERAMQVKEWGADYVVIHTGVDEFSNKKDEKDENKPYFRDSELEPMTRLIGKDICGFSGGVTPERIRENRKIDPGFVIVGGYIIHAKDPAKAAKEIRDAIDGK